MHYCKDNHDKMSVYSFWMTILIVMYHLAPHIMDLFSFRGDRYCRNFFELFGSIALNYFFAASAYKFFVSKKTIKDKLTKRIQTLIIPFLTWNTLYILLYTLQNGVPDVETLILGYTLSPFDGPLWYIFVLYIFFVVFAFVHSKNKQVFMSLIILLAIVASIFHLLLIKEIVVFPYFAWIERTLRMLPPFLIGAFGAEKKNRKLIHNASNKVSSIAIVGAVICIVFATYVGDSMITIILMYLCTALLWRAYPNFSLKKNSIMHSEMFVIYALHEGVIVVTLALINKFKIVISNNISIMLLIIALEIFVIFGIGLLLNVCLKKLPAKIDILLTGGRNVRTYRDFKINKR